jgi:hypothetical protein
MAKIGMDKECIIKHNFLIFNEGTVITVHNHIMLVYIPSEKGLESLMSYLMWLRMLWMIMEIWIGGAIVMKLDMMESGLLEA